MSRLQNLLIVISALVTALAGAAAPGFVYAQAAPDLPISQAPLFQRTAVAPNLIMSLDDSGSMDYETVFPTNDGSMWWNHNSRSFVGFDENDNPAPGRLNFNRTGNLNPWRKHTMLFPFGWGGGTTGDITNGDQGTFTNLAIAPVSSLAYARSPNYNLAYFNPSVTYTPWQREDASFYPQSNPQSAPLDGGRGTNRIDLTLENLTAVSNNTAQRGVFRLFEGFVLPAGTQYILRAKSFTNTCPAIQYGDTSTSLTAWRTVPAGGLAIRNAVANTVEFCDFAIRYFIPTFYLPRGTALPEGYGYTAAPLGGFFSPDGATELLRYEIRPGNFQATGDKYLAAINNFANWFTYYRKRHQALRAGLTQAFSGVDNVRADFVQINNLSDVAMLDLNNKADRQTLYDGFISLSGDGNTPNRQALDHVGKQFQRTDAGAPITKSCQKNFAMVFTDGFTTLPDTTIVDNVDGTASRYFPTGTVFPDNHSNTIADIAAKYYSTTLRTDLAAGQVPIPAGCPVNATDPIADPKLDCNANLHMNTFGITLGARGTIYDVNTAATENPYVNIPAWPDPVLERHPSAVDDLWHAAINGRGEFLNARTPSEIKDAVKRVVDIVSSEEQPSGSLAVEGVRLNADSRVYLPQFSVNGSDWSGDLLAYSVNPKTGNVSANPIWRLSRNIRSEDAPTRRVFARRPAIGAAPAAVVAFNNANFGATADQQAQALGFANAAAVTTSYPGRTVADVYAYLKGDDTYEIDPESIDVARVFRTRTTLLGDSINSQPEIQSGNDIFAWIRTPALNSGPNKSPAISRGYDDYVREKRLDLNNRSKVYIGANDGMLHAISPQNGLETFAYIPSAALAKMGLLANPKYEHQYYVDGDINVIDAYLTNTNNWGTVLLGSTGRGGKSVFALDVTRPNNLGAGSLLWELTGTDPDLGQAIGRINVMYGEDGNWYAVFGNGYNSTNRNAVLFIVNLATGAVRKLTTNDGTAANGLGEVALIDADVDGKTDAIYGGDMLGNVWKFNVSATTAASWSVAFGNKALFTTARAPATVGRPITGGFEVARGPGSGVMLYFGTGRYLTQGDATIGANPQVETLYAVLDANPAATAVPLRESNLVQQKMQALGTPPSPVTRSINAQTVDYFTRSGWYLDLVVTDANGVAQKSTGERFIGRPRLEDGAIFFVTYEPDASECKPGGKNFLYGLGPLTGGGLLGGGSLLNPPKECVGNCGTADFGEGAPITELDFTRIPPPCKFGIDPGCSAPDDDVCDDPDNAGYDPYLCKCDPKSSRYDENDPACQVNPGVCVKQAQNPNDATKAVQFLVPCGRQSWRQVR